LNNYYDVVIVGGGIGGLGVLHYLKKKNFKVILLEKSARCGGLVQSATDRNHLLEIGPNAFLKSYKNTYDFICEVGLADQIISNRPEAYHRYIFRNGKIHPLPEDPISFFKSDLLSFAAKCRLFLEPFVLKGPSEESIKDFGNRRFGKEVTEVILDAMVKGICTGDISQLDINSMFPKLKDIEKNYRSLLLFLLFFKKRNVQKTNDGKKTFFLSLKKGMGDLSHHVHNKYRAEIQTECLVTQISKEDAGYQVYTEKGIFYAKEVVLATRAMEAASIIKNTYPDYADILYRIPYANVATVTMSWKKEEVLHPLDGFGFLSSSKEKLNILGALFSSSLFPNRTPEDEKMIKVYLGGPQKEEMLKLSDQEIIELVLKDIQPILQVHGKYQYVKLRRIENAIPLFNMGHKQIKEQLSEMALKYKGIYLVGNYLEGISVDATIKVARTVSEQINN